ncbi:pogo transposable [Pyrenophora seminiperda CCB06]|uniref:Pogo transposable n=1 Tax=Pyrenophora seminiperda CCB06 TaxID=1302712 RepID=A0A3M7LXR2_9PLEO|nr:pogo transposable [Pyrenophora seminiperda CCB06]
MKPETIMKSFQATGVWPMDAEVVLKRFKTTTSEQDEALKLGQQGDGDSWIQLRIIFDAAVANKAKVEAKRLSRSIHSLQVNNALLYNENSGLQQALNTKKKHKMKRTTLDLRHRDEYYGGAVFWSPRKLREATKQDEAEQLQL